VTHELRDYVNNARLRRQQNGWVWSAAGVGLITGMLLTLFLPRLLPGSVDMAVAATVLNGDRWNAGASLMQSGSREGWRSLMAADHLVRDNREALNACLEAAARAKKEQRCTIAVTARAP
jgi:hypothetical protein